MQLKAISHLRKCRRKESRKEDQQFPCNSLHNLSWSGPGRSKTRNQSRMTRRNRSLVGDSPGGCTTQLCRRCMKLALRTALEFAQWWSWSTSSRQRFPCPDNGPTISLASHDSLGPWLWSCKRLSTDSQGIMRRKVEAFVRKFELSNQLSKFSRIKSNSDNTLTEQHWEPLQWNWLLFNPWQWT